MLPLWSPAGRGKVKDEDGPSSSSGRSSRRMNGSAGGGTRQSSAVSTGLFSRARKKTTKKTREMTPLLPTSRYDIPSSTDGVGGGGSTGRRRHHQHGQYHQQHMPSSQRTSSSRRKRSAGMPPTGDSTCSSFVFGGMHYPGKDKRRRRSLCYRIFFSSPARSCVTMILLGYVTVSYVLSPMGAFIYEMGTRLASDGGGGGGGAADGVRPKLVNILPPLEKLREKEMEMRRYMHTVAGRRGPGHLTLEQLDVLKGIVPNWARRNEPKQKQPDEDSGQDSNSKEEEQTAEKDASEQNQSGRKDKEEGAPDTPSKDETVAAVDDGLITLRTMETSKSCPDLPKKGGAATPSVSLVLQSTVDRLWLLEETCKRWTDPIVLVVYYDDDKKKKKRDDGDGDEKQKPWSDVMDWHKVCPQVTIIPYAKSPEEKDWEYPINKLRNAGLRALQTTHFMVVDVDFVPSGTLQSAIHDHFQYVPDDRDTLIVPAFERTGVACKSVEECRTFLHDDPNFIPSTFNDVKKCVEGEKCTVFQSDNNWEGHFTTKSEVWLRKNWYEEVEGVDGRTAKRPRKIDCFHSYRYEPYVVLRWCDGVTPFYDERFHGYGKNKIEYVAHLRFLRYTFSVLPEGYIVHHPHPESKAKESWNDQEGFDLHVEMDQLYPKFLRELADMHGKPELLQCTRHRGH